MHQWKAKGKVVAVVKETNNQSRFFIHLVERKNCIFVIDSFVVIKGGAL